MTEEPDVALTPWEAVQVAWEKMVAAIKVDRGLQSPDTKEAAREYRAARAHAMEVAPSARPSSRTPPPRG